MKRDTFAERLSAYDRHWFHVTLALVSAVLLVAVSCPWAFGLAFWTPQDHERTIRITCSLVLAGFCVAALVFVECYHRVTVRRFALACPSCGAALTGRQRQFALVEGKCGHCGTRISNEGQAEPS
jgi:hypothetical protein